jgi:hypothetical protein
VAVKDRVSGGVLSCNLPGERKKGNIPRHPKQGEISLLPGVGSSSVWSDHPWLLPGGKSLPSSPEDAERKPLAGGSSYQRSLHNVLQCQAGTVVASISAG